MSSKTGRKRNAETLEVLDPRILRMKLFLMGCSVEAFDLFLNDKKKPPTGLLTLLKSFEKAVDKSLLLNEDMTRKVRNFQDARDHLTKMLREKGRKHLTTSQFETKAKSFLHVLFRGSIPVGLLERLIRLERKVSDVTHSGQAAAATDFLGNLPIFNIRSNRTLKSKRREARNWGRSESLPRLVLKAFLENYEFKNKKRALSAVVILLEECGTEPNPDEGFDWDQEYFFEG